VGADQLFCEVFTAAIWGNNSLNNSPFSPGGRCNQIGASAEYFGTGDKSSYWELKSSKTPVSFCDPEREIVDVGPVARTTAWKLSQLFRKVRQRHRLASNQAVPNHRFTTIVSHPKDRC